MDVHHTVYVHIISMNLVLIHIMLVNNQRERERESFVCVYVMCNNDDHIYSIQKVNQHYIVDPIFLDISVVAQNE